MDERNIYSAETGYPASAEIVEDLSYEGLERKLSTYLDNFDAAQAAYDAESSTEHEHSPSRRAAIAPFESATKKTPAELREAIAKSKKAILDTKQPYLKHMSDGERRTLLMLQNLLVELDKWAALPKDFEQSTVAKEVVRRLEEMAAADNLKAAELERASRLEKSRDFGDQWMGRTEGKTN